MTTYDDRRLWPGTVPPVAGSPARPAGSVRRTTSIDIVRPDGLTGTLVLAGAGRDLVAGSGRCDVASVEIEIDYLGDRTITGVRSDPVVDGLDRLVGARAGSGFRRVLAEAVPDLAARASLLHQLLDEVTPTTLISGSSLARSGSIALAAGSAMRPAGAPSRMPIDICAGWVADGEMIRAITETQTPLLGWGPPAPDLLDPTDPHGWHEMAALPPTSMRRRRRIDLVPDGDALSVDVRYRDSYWEDDGTETVVHEYGLGAVVDPETWSVVAARATPGPLPAPECPGAARSADRLVGRPVGSLREVVRDEFVGTSTCTHLNDVFRSLADVPHLWALAVSAG